MAIKLKSILLENFKAYHEKQMISLSDINVFMGANSSGKSSGIQSLLGLKQTYESKQEHIGLLLTGKYATLGAFKDVLYSNEDLSNEEKFFSIGISLFDSINKDEGESLDIKWIYHNNDQLINGVELKKLELIENQDKVMLVIEKDNEYRLYVNDKKQTIKILMNNMFVDSVIIKFDVEYNRVLIDLIRDIIEWILQSSKYMVKINENDLITNQMENIVRMIITSGSLSKRRVNRKENHQKRFNQIISIMLKVEEKFRLQDKTLSENILIGNIFPLILDSESPIDKLEDIWKKYKDKKPRDNSGETGMARISLHKYLQQREFEKTKSFNLGVFEKYNKWLKTMLANIRYLGPLREMPKSLYSWNIDVDPEYVGSKGEYFPSVLSTLDHKKIKTIIPGSDKIEECGFYEALYLWCQYLQVANEIHVDSDYSFGMNIKVHNIHDNKADIMNVGVGTSQVIPVLIMGLISPENSLVIYEQPELHLHPFSQSRLADFFIAMSKLEKQFIIETHSEYMLHRFRYHLIKNSFDESKIKLNFFANKNNGTMVREGTLGQDGSIEYPCDFVDQNQSLFREILNLTSRG